MISATSDAEEDVEVVAGAAVFVVEPVVVVVGEVVSARTHRTALCPSSSCPTSLNQQIFFLILSYWAACSKRARQSFCLYFMRFRPEDFLGVIPDYRDLSLIMNIPVSFDCRDHRK